MFYQDSDVFVVICFAAAVLVLLNADEAWQPQSLHII